MSAGDRPRVPGGGGGGRHHHLLQPSHRGLGGQPGLGHRADPLLLHGQPQQGRHLRGQVRHQEEFQPHLQSSRGRHLLPAHGGGVRGVRAEHGRQDLVVRHDPTPRGEGPVQLHRDRPAHCSAHLPRGLHQVQLQADGGHPEAGQPECVLTQSPHQSIKVCMDLYINNNNNIFRTSSGKVLLVQMFLHICTTIVYDTITFRFIYL